MFFSGPAAQAALGDAQPASRRSSSSTDRAHIQNYGRSLPLPHAAVALSPRSSICGIAACARARKGRPGPFAQAARSEGAGEEGAGGSHRPRRRRSAIRCARSTSCTELYDSLAEARREVGEEALPFHKFADLVKSQVKKLRQAGTPEVAFRVAVKDGKVSFTARALKGAGDDD